MNSNTDLHLLAVRYLDDAMSPAERNAYIERLRSDESARNALNDAVLQAVTLAEAMRAMPSRASAFDVLEKPRFYARRGYRMTVWAASVLMMIGLGAMLWPRTSSISKDSLVTITTIYGSASWTGADGETQEMTSRVTSLPAGTLILDEDTALLEFVFRDGTRVLLRGPAELVFADEGQKRLHLRSGSMVADVTKQPDGAPLIVRTPTAEGTVLGTRFELSAATERTELAVDHGLVQLRRLADNQTLQVSEQRMATVGRDTSVRLSSSVRNQVPKHWQSDLSTLPEENWDGDWVEPTESSPGRMQAVGRFSKHANSTHRRVVVKALHGPLVALSPETTIRARYRSREEATIELFVGAMAGDGRFAGNYKILLHPGHVPSTTDGWRDVKLTLSDFERADAKKKTPAPEALTFFYITSHEKDVGLEVASLEIDTPQP